METSMKKGHIAKVTVEDLYEAVKYVTDNLERLNEEIKENKHKTATNWYDFLHSMANLIRDDFRKSGDIVLAATYCSYHVNYIVKEAHSQEIDKMLLDELERIQQVLEATRTHYDEDNRDS